MPIRVAEAPSEIQAQEVLGSIVSRMFQGESVFESCWPTEAVVCHGDVARFAELDATGVFSHPDHLLRVLELRGAQMCAIPLDTGNDYNCVNVPAGDAANMYRLGQTVFAPRIEELFPAVDRWLKLLWSELGLPPTIPGRAFIYLAESGGVSPHFDANANFVVQLAGKKRWFVAENRDVVNPTAGYAITMTEPPPALLDCAAVLPRSAPVDPQVLDLSPGSAFFLPRGWWHWTETLEPSLSLHFIFPQPTWADLVTSAIGRWLVRKPEWRALADGLYSTDSGRRKIGSDQLESLWREVRGEFQELSSHEMLKLVGAPTNSA